MRDVLRQPVAALRKRLRLGVDAANLLMLAVGHQIVVDAQADLATDGQMGHPHEHIQGVGHPAIGRVLDGDDAKIDVLPVDLSKTAEILPTGMNSTA